MNNVMLPRLPALLGMKNTIELGSLTLDIRHVTILDSLCDPSTTDEELLPNEMSKHLTSIAALSISHRKGSKLIVHLLKILKLAIVAVSNLYLKPLISGISVNCSSNLEPLSLAGRDENNINQLTSLQKLLLLHCRVGMVSYFVKKGSFPTNITSLEIGDFVGQLPVPPPSPLERGLHKLSSLTTLALVGLDWPWGDMVSFPEEEMFLPTSLINLNIRSFRNLEGLSYEEFQNLASLQTLEICSCPRLTSFPKEGLPPSLLHLLIYKCPELATFPEQGFPPSLLSLMIWGCNPILKQKCEKGKEYWPII
ncbi:putative disease resistance protein At3g14460 [Camellia sinensis]|uniref:putative disease resistance protein At3g14460 n=1 Tax=Camellia sinensis TaxID=4442 RepID=UPI00103669AB|nr:putative disease resistance protein At3g14460 [Camellia sinensis]